MSSRCELCDLEFDHCKHGLEQRSKKSLAGVIVQVSPKNVAHLVGCLHKGDDQDFSKWGEINSEGAWIHLRETMPADGGVVSDLVTNSGSVIGLQVTHVCKHCRHGL
jgi:hypothetical protein